MNKLCLNSRDELMIILLEKVAYFQAQGNYTRLCYIGGETHLLTIGLTKVEEYLRKSWPKNETTPFIRLGRSVIINQTYLSGINVLKQRVSLSDFNSNTHHLSVPKPLLKEYKEKINQYYVGKNGE